MVDCGGVERLSVSVSEWQQRWRWSRGGKMGAGILIQLCAVSRPADYMLHGLFTRNSLHFQIELFHQRYN